MKMRILAGTSIAAVALWCAVASADLQEGVKLQADGKDIDVKIGHLVPTVVDFNGDGNKDLIVGQFSRGQIRLYLNGGTDKAPVFKDVIFLEAGAKPISLAAG